MLNQKYLLISSDESDESINTTILNENDVDPWYHNMVIGQSVLLNSANEDFGVKYKIIVRVL